MNCGNRRAQRTDCTRPTSERFQPFPTAGPLTRNLNLTHRELEHQLRGVTPSPVFAYIVRSCRHRAGEDPALRHLGSGPNIANGYVSLCTCKHQMRTWRDRDEWKGAWIAGWTSRDNVDGEHYLFYLTRVAAAFDSQFELWEALPPATRRAKSAARHRLWDLFEPKPDSLTRLEVPAARSLPAHYIPPCSDHSHAGAWHKDIHYEGPAGRARFLLGDPAASFVWSSPRIVNRYAGGAHPRTKLWPELSAFLANTEPAE